MNITSKNCKKKHYSRWLHTPNFFLDKPLKFSGIAAKSNNGYNSVINLRLEVRNYIIFQKEEIGIK